MTRLKACLIIVMLCIAAPAAAESEDSLCFDEAGMQYSINPQILRAIAQVESGFKPRAINWNTNGTYDFGVMQINSLWGNIYGEEWWNTLGDPCANIKAGAMILSSCMKKYGYSWKAIGCYNSQTPGKRNKYALKVFDQLRKIERDEQLNSAYASQHPSESAPIHTDGFKDAAHNGPSEDQPSLTQAQTMPADQQEPPVTITD